MFLVIYKADFIGDGESEWNSVVQTTVDSVADYCDYLERFNSNFDDCIKDWYIYDMKNPKRLKLLRQKPKHLAN